eukprot:765742-Hanusia_phi.AAC.2
MPAPPPPPSPPPPPPPPPPPAAANAEVSLLLSTLFPCIYRENETANASLFCSHIAGYYVSPLTFDLACSTVDGQDGSRVSRELSDNWS